MFSAAKRALKLWGEYQRQPAGGVNTQLGYKSTTVEHAIAQSKPRRLSRDEKLKLLKAKFEKVREQLNCPQCKASLHPKNLNSCTKCGWKDNSDKHMTFRAAYPKEAKGARVRPSSKPSKIVMKIEAILNELQYDTEKHVLFQIAHYKYADENVNELAARELEIPLSTYKVNLKLLWCHVDAKL